MGNNGLRLREYRRAAGLTQRALARLAIVSRSSICHVERGRYAPTPKFASKVARGLSGALGVDLGLLDIFPEDFPLAIRQPAQLPEAAG